MASVLDYEAGTLGIRVVRLLIPIVALICGSASLMIAGGINGLILPLRGSVEAFSAFSLGLLGTGWAIGYITGCVQVPRMVQRVGHIRTFAVMATCATFSVLLSLLIIQPAAWIILRALAGFSFAGAAMIVESWLNETTESRYRGRVFGAYTMVNLLATTTGQMLITLGDPSGYVFFVLAALFYALSLVPTSLTTTEQPKPLVETRLDLPRLLKNSPVAVAGSLLIGVSNSAFNTLGVVFGEAINLNVASIALMMSISLLAGSLLQIPVGLMSDKLDRRAVLVGLSVVAAVVDLYFIVVRPEDAVPVLVATALFGGSIFAMYPVIVAHAFDHAEPGSYLKISGGLLLLFGVGSIGGPLVAGAAMLWDAQTGLFYTTLAAHSLLAAFAYFRITQRDPVADVDKTDFVGIPSARLVTPESAVLDPRVDEDATPVSESGRDRAAHNQN
jgi:MFS family permease